MTFASLSSSAKTVQVGVIVRNICNSTLTLLFTTALFIWGFAVNRNRAWRTDGGTAAFGAGALMLAVASTALNFMEVKVDHLSWLTNLLLSIILWQSWLGGSFSLFPQAESRLTSFPSRFVSLLVVGRVRLWVRRGRSTSSLIHPLPRRLELTRRVVFWNS
jgi:hypothetical protein